MTPIFGLLVVDKPPGITSHDVVARVRRICNERRVGHAGTLDPLATGVLVLALGEATRLLEYITGVRKTYAAEITLGVLTDTYDTEGEVITRNPLPPTLTCAEVDSALAHFTGPLEQVPPVYSAVKVQGKAAHARARAGEDVELDPRPVTVYSLERTHCQPPTVAFTTEVSSGTYIRSLAHDVGQHLGVGAVLSALRRTAVGRFTLAEATTLEDLDAAAGCADMLVSPHRAFPSDALLQLDATSLEHIRHGRPVPAEGVTAGIAPAVTPDGKMVAVVEGFPQRGHWQPRKVFRKQIESAS